MSGIQVIDRVAALLEVLAGSDRPVPLKRLGVDTGLHPSTAFRILAALSEHGFVERDDTGAYRLGSKLLELGGRVRAGLDLREAARPVMEWLRDQVEETVNLTVREGDEVVYVERAIARRTIRAEQLIGSRAPLHVTAVGKLMLGEGGTSAVRAYAARTGLHGYTPRTLSHLEALLDDAGVSVARGYGLDNEEAELGVGCIGVLVRDSSGAAVAGLSISAPMERRRDEWIPLVREAGRRISRRLGFHANGEPSP